ncbi:MAG: hypothetical protein ACTSV2_14105 [Candidatus Thorarchaeota archaeon]
MDILDWGQCPSPITFEYVFRAGSINEFFNMTESHGDWLNLLSRWVQAWSYPETNQILSLID